jgi:hypothetical protein
MITNETKKQRIENFWGDKLPENLNVIIYKIACLHKWETTDSILVEHYLDTYKVLIVNKNIKLVLLEKSMYDDLLKDYINMLTMYNLEQPTLEELVDLTAEDIEYNIAFIEKNYNRENNENNLYEELKYDAIAVIKEENLEDIEEEEENLEDIEEEEENLEEDKEVVKEEILVI